MIVHQLSRADARQIAVRAQLLDANRPTDLLDIVRQWSAYGQSKTANVLFAVEATKQWASDGITVNALMPGGIRTNLQRYVSEEELDRLRAAAGAPTAQWKTPEQGAATSILVATSPLLDGIGGRYFEDCNEAKVGELSALNGVAAYALDPEAAAHLWQVSLDTLAAG